MRYTLVNVGTSWRPHGQVCDLFRAQVLDCRLTRHGKVLVFQTREAGIRAFHFDRHRGCWKEVV